MVERVKETEQRRRQPVYRVMKRAFDILASIVAMLILWPLVLVLILLIRIDSMGSAFYIHERIGKNGKKIGLYKFRTMYIPSDPKYRQLTPQEMERWYRNYKLEDDPRVTRVGNVLRKTSLDELPQLLNILMGDMSFVGPRPVVSGEIERYGACKNEFLSVTPGLTGYWQAYARNSVSYDERIRMELYYVRNCSLWLDTKILFKTVGTVISQKGAA